MSAAGTALTVIVVFALIYQSVHKNSMCTVRGVPMRKILTDYVRMGPELYIHFQAVI
jgi:hypothetical protein